MTAAPWLPARFVGEAEAWPLRPGLLALSAAPGFPPVARWGPLVAAAGLAAPGVRFEPQVPRVRRRARRGEGPAAALPGYDASIVERGVVPSREGSWHDLLNCLVWHAFPRSKAALHRRQLAAQRAEAAGMADAGEGAGLPARVAPAGVARRAPGRGAHRDALALLDEGGVLLGRVGNGARAGAERLALFGHALHEQRLRAPTEVTALLVELALPGPAPESDAAWLTALDAALAFELASAGAFAHPAAYPRVAVQLGGGDATPPRSAPARAPRRPG